ncbi:hypothetical protein V6N13_087459 [Hibiscus sabdariffa]
MADNDSTFILQIANQPNQNSLYFGDFSNNPDDGKAMMITKRLSMPPILNFHLVSSCDGLLCLRATYPSFQLCIYNPFTWDHIELPKLSHRAGNLGFGFDATTKKYKVVEISLKRTTRRGFRRGRQITAASSSSSESVVHVLTVGSPTWRNLGSLPFHFMWQNSQVLVNGKLHWIATEHMIMSFDLATEEFKEVPMPDCIGFNGKFHELVVLRGCLSAVSFDDDAEEWEIWVMRECWVKEFSIGVDVTKILWPNDGRVSWNNPRYFLPRKCIRVLCLLRSGEIILKYRNKVVVAYDPHGRTIHDLRLTFEGIPRCFKAVVHVASLIKIDNFVNT